MALHVKRTAAAARASSAPSDEEIVRALYEVAVAAATSSEPRVVARAAVEVLDRLTWADGAAVHTWDDESGRLAPLYETHEGVAGAGAEEGRGLVGVAFAAGEPLLVTDYQAWQHRAAPAPAGVRAAMAVPFSGEHGRIGVVSVWSGQPRDLHEADVRLLSLFASQMGPVLQSAQRNAERRRLLQGLEALHRVAVMAGGGLGPDELVGVACDAAREMLRADVARIYWWDPEREVLDLLGGSPAPAEPWLRPQAGVGASGLAFRRGAPVIVEDYRNWQHAFRRNMDEDLASGMSVPLRVADRTLGAIGIGFRSPRHFSPVDVRQLTLLAAQLGPALESARLHAELTIDRQQLEALLGNAPVVLFATDADGRLTTVRGRPLADYGLDGAELVGKSPSEVLGGDGRLEAQLSKALTGSSVQTVVEDVRFNREFEVWARPHLDRAGNVEGLVGVALDVTERRRAEEAERGSEAKSRFLASMSHELRTPLNSILGFAQLLMRPESGGLTERQTRYVGHIEGSGKHLLELINDVLDLSKVEAGQMTVALEKVRLSSFIQVAIDRVMPLADAKGVELGMGPGPRLEVDADRRRLDQVVMNLLSNAIKFTPSGGWVTVVAREDPSGGVCIDVGDSGPGISADDQSRLFNEFTQLVAGAASDQPGTGLGLALSRRLVELQGGRLSVVSEPGRGSVFTVWLPGGQVPAPRTRPAV